MPPVLKKEGDELRLNLSGCRGFEFEDAREKVKAIPGRDFDWDTKEWIVEATAQNADRLLKTVRPVADEELIQWVAHEMASAEESLVMQVADDAELLVPWANKRMPWQPEYVNDEKFEGLLPYQRSGVDAIVTGDGRMLLGDDMGLGKTLQMITAVEEWRLRVQAETGIYPEGPKLIVCPNTLKGTWARELNRWLDDPEVVIVDGRTPKKRAEQIKAGVENDAWIIVNWEQLQLQKTKTKRQLRTGGTKTEVKKHLKDPQLEETEWLAILADESHRAKNGKAKQTQGLWRLQTRLHIDKYPSSGVMVGASGTPMLNSPADLWAQLAWLWPDKFHERGNAHKQGAMAYSYFYDDFVESWEDHNGREHVTGVKNPDALKFTLKGKMVRRTAAILGLKGRKRIFYDVPLNPGQQKLYDEAEKAMWLAVEADIAKGNKDAIEFARTALEGGSVANLIRIPNGAARLVRQQQIIENAALLGGADDSAIMDDFVQKFVDSRPEQWVFFFKHKESCHLMAERLRKQGARAEVINGDVPTAARTKLEDMFQRGEVDALCGTLDAMKEGFTFTRARLVGFGSRSFVPAHNEQGEMRLDRLGQQRQVLVYIPLAVDTIAVDKVHAINVLKEGIVKAVITKDEIEEEVAA